MTRPSKTLALSGIIALAAAGLGVTSPAAASEDQCLDGYFCMWSEPDFTGEFLMTRSDAAFLGERSLNMNDKISSVMNRTGYLVEACSDAGLQGLCWFFIRTARLPNLDGMDDFDNQVSSINIDPED